MKKIGLLSDTHDWLDDAVFAHFANCDEIWHSGDFGSLRIAEQLSSFKPLRGVYGNIDGKDVRDKYPEILRFSCESVNVLMIHIGGFPPKYNKDTIRELDKAPAQLFVSGHSHILKIMYDEKRACLHMNPGAAGNHGWHKIRTIVRFSIDGKNISDCEIIELGKRGEISSALQEG